MFYWGGGDHSSETISEIKVSQSKYLKLES